MKVGISFLYAIWHSPVVRSQLVSRTPNVSPVSILWSLTHKLDI